MRRPGRAHLDRWPDRGRSHERGGQGEDGPKDSWLDLTEVPNALVTRGLDAALADPYRRRVIELLREGALLAGDLARALKLAPPAMSRHLRALKQCGLLDESHPPFDARVRNYSLRAEPMIELKRWLEGTEQLWADQLVAFKADIEKAAPG